MEIKAVIVVLPQDCRSGSCDCEGAKNCKFKRCENCDDLVDENGKWIDDDEYHGECPDECGVCGAPLVPIR